MALSELGLTPAEVEGIMADIAGQPSVSAAAAATTAVTTLQPRTGQESVVPVAVSLQPPKLTTSPTKTSELTPTPPPSLTRPPVPLKVQEGGIGTALVAAGAGFVVGGPVGALIGGVGTYWLTRKK